MSENLPGWRGDKIILKLRFSIHHAVERQTE